MNTQKRKRKGFTIVELVIVIAVIAILAAVLIPTFSGIIQKANLSSDMQAVREMNMALAADEALNGKPESVEGAMQVLADAGYNSEHWQCLSKGYQVYWYSTDNRIILYNSMTAQVAYPKEYDPDMFTNNPEFSAHLEVYNNNHVEAQKFPAQLGSSSSNTQTEVGSDLASTGTTDSAKTNLTNITAALGEKGNTELKNILGVTGSDKMYVYGTKEERSQGVNSFASLQIMSVGKDKTPILHSVGPNAGNLKENLFYLRVEKGNNPSTEAVKAAQKEAGTFLYNIFDQVTTGKLAEDISIVIEPGTVLDVSGKEWAPCKRFTGYFGTSDEKHPVVIDGAILSKSTGVSQTVRFPGKSNSDYSLTGFFGTVYGKTTIENVKFTNVDISEPASDFNLNAYKGDGKTPGNRNCVAIIGGICDSGTGTVTGGVWKSSIPPDVVLRNIIVDNTCNIKGCASAAGLVGYIGAAHGSPSDVGGNVLIENCHVSANVSSDYGESSYGCVGGIIALIHHSYTVNVTLKDTIFDGTLTSRNSMGGLIGDMLQYSTVTIDNCDVKNARLNQDTAREHYCGQLIGYFDLQGEHKGATTYEFIKFLFDPAGHGDMVNTDSAIPAVSRQHAADYTAAELKEAPFVKAPETT